MDVRSALVAHPQATELPEPGQRPLNDPPVHAQPATMRCTPRAITGQMWRARSTFRHASES